MFQAGEKYGCLTITEYISSTNVKCQCKCGKTFTVDEQILINKPRYCIKPSRKYSNAKDCVEQTISTEAWFNKNAIIFPSEEYCGLWNAMQNKKIEKGKVVEKATNYDVDYSGKIYESLEIGECVSDSVEKLKSHTCSIKNRKYYFEKSKQYRCKCYLCGREQLIVCEDFGIHPPTAYGYTAYHGYWSKAKCDCHEISSFQWIVNKLLFEASIPYRVEYRFSDLLGVSNQYPLKFDFAVFNENGEVKALIECQGEQHYKPVDEFGGDYYFNKQQKNDERKRQYAKEHSIPLIEISYKEKKIETIKSILIKNDILEREG